MSSASLTIAIISTDKKHSKAILKHLKGEFSHIQIKVIENRAEIEQCDTETGWLFINFLDDGTDIDLSYIEDNFQHKNITPIIGFSNKSKDIVPLMKLGYCDVVSLGNLEHLKLVITRELAHLVETSAMRTKGTKAFSDFTGVHSRLEFLECISALATELHQSHSAIVYLQLDNFAWINENMGMTAGDRFLQDVGSALLGILQGEDFAARYQGGNFVLFLSADDDKVLRSKADMIRESILELSSEFQENLISSTASLGVRLFDPEMDITELIADAYDASDLARTGGGDGVHYFRPETDESDDKRNKRAWNDRIREAFERDLFVLYFQPIVSIQSDSVGRYEVLLRMQDEDSNIISPGTFLPFAERAGLMADIDRKVIIHSIERAQEEQEKGNVPELFIKLSGRSVDDKTMVSWICKTIKACDYPADKFVFEITESIALHHLVQTRNLCQRLKDVGCKVALDHFGTRFRSFKLIENIPIDYLKIDGSLVQHLSNNKGHQTIVKKIVRQTTGKDITLIAESVQEAAFLPILWQYQIPYVQGYFLGVPTERMDYDFKNLLI